jgi:hypothetical protein
MLLLKIIIIIIIIMYYIVTIDLEKKLKRNKEIEDRALEMVQAREIKNVKRRRIVVSSQEDSPGNIMNILISLL